MQKKKHLIKQLFRFSSTSTIKYFSRITFRIRSTGAPATATKILANDGNFQTLSVASETNSVRLEGAAKSDL